MQTISEIEFVNILLIIFDCLYILCADDDDMIDMTLLIEWDDW